MEKEKYTKEVKETKKPKSWYAVADFHDKNDFSKVYKKGDEVEYTEERENLKLIELK